MPKKTWMDELAKHFPTLIVVLLALFAFTLTNCAPVDGTQKTQAQKKVAYAGVWARAADYCEYIKQRNENCVEVKAPKTQASGLTSDSTWKVIVISEYGIVSSYLSDAPLAVIETTNRNNQILKPYLNYEFEVQINTTKDLPDPTTIFLEGDFLKIDVAQLDTQVPYFKVTDKDAYQFSKTSRP